MRTITNLSTALESLESTLLASVVLGHLRRSPAFKAACDVADAIGSAYIDVKRALASLLEAGLVEQMTVERIALGEWVQVVTYRAVAQ